MDSSIIIIGGQEFPTKCPEKCKEVIIENNMQDLCCFRCPILNCVPDEEGFSLCSPIMYRKDWALIWKEWFNSDMSKIPILTLL